ncbi:sperm-associated acrosin inhibitor-like [Myotis yumanensis]|uniref:sperm-associated acrosin inhibitor-like n=1 Tax=Myotis yumanensis TaxID=159337 RepID=UPI0038D04307
MSFFSSCIRIIFITALAFSLYSGNSLVLARRLRTPPNCDGYKGRTFTCSNNVNTLCASNGYTYKNGCLFCAAMLDSHKPIQFRHYGKC